MNGVLIICRLNLQLGRAAFRASGPSYFWTTKSNQKSPGLRIRVVLSMREQLAGANSAPDPVV